MTMLETTSIAYYLSDTWQCSLVREVVAEQQEIDNNATQLGGVGIEVEIDKVCFRARSVIDEECT